MTCSSRLVLVLLLVVITACKKKFAHDDPPAPAPVAAAKSPSPVTPVKAAAQLPLDPVRAETATANRHALETMARSIQCPQTPPSTLVRFCAAATDFPTGTAAEIPQGDTLLMGVAAIIASGAPTVATLGTEIPIVLRIHREGDKIEARQVALRDPGEADAMPMIAARIGKTIDGKWDHVDVSAAFKSQLDELSKLPALDPLEASGDSYWPKDLDGLELRRAKDRWVGVGAPEGPGGKHVVMLFTDHMKLLGPKEQSPQQITVMHL